MLLGSLEWWLLAIVFEFVDIISFENPASLVRESVHSLRLPEVVAFAESVQIEILRVDQLPWKTVQPEGNEDSILNDTIVSVPPPSRSVHGRTRVRLVAATSTPLRTISSLGVRSLIRPLSSRSGMFALEVTRRYWVTGRAGEHTPPCPFLRLWPV